jgi:hypothetical protein
LFDGRTQGYDGVLCGGCILESGEQGEEALPNRFTVLVSFFYNIDLDELMELAGEASVRPSDLFDWIVIRGSPVGSGDIVELSYECA